MYIKRGTSFFPTNAENTDIRPALLPGNYLIKAQPNGDLYFDNVASFPLMAKVYGDIEAKADRILNTFESRAGSTGVLLTGEKGSGKTMLAKLLAIKAAEKFGIPTVTVNVPYRGEAFNHLIQELPPTVVMFDEFEKTYDSDAQTEVLTLLDGVFPSKKLFILTCNNKYALDSHLTNRPGRIFYVIEYKGVTPEFIEEYCDDNLTDKSHIDNIKKASSLFEAFNFDMLKALVEEMNRYGESPYDALKMLNIRPTKVDGSYLVSILHKGTPILSKHIDTGTIRGNPLARENTTIAYYLDTGEVDSDGDANLQYFSVKLTNSMLISTSIEDGTFVFLTEDNVQVTLTKEVRKDVDFYDFMAF